MKNNIVLKIKNFYKRWNISLDEEKCFRDFKNRTLLTIDKVLGERFLENENLRESYIKIIGKYIPRSFIYQPSFGRIIRIFSIGETKWFKDTEIFELLQKETDFVEYIKYLQYLFWIDIDYKLKEELSKEFSKDIRISCVSVCLKSTKNGIVFYPKGAKLLDEKLVNDILHWLNNYPKVYKPFEKSLNLYQNKKYTRELLDNLRFSLEQFFKTILEIRKPYKKNLGGFLKNRKISSEIRNIYATLYTYFENYQDDRVKHNEKFNQLEVEFLMYLTGSFLRFLIQICEEK